MNIPDIPILGASGLMTLVSLVHILLVSIAGSGPIMAWLIEGVGLRRSDPRFGKIAKTLMSAVLELAVVGGIFGSGIVVVLVGQYPGAIAMLFNIFFWFVVLQLVCFIAGLAFQFAYYFTFGKERVRRHRTWGLIGAILPLIVKVVFSAAVGFTNNPGGWPASGSIWAAVFNPMTVPMFLHRLLTGVSLVAFFIVAIALWQSRRRRKIAEEERKQHAFALRLGGRIAFWSTLAQVLPGLLVLYVGLPPEGRADVLGALHLPWMGSIVLMLVSVGVVWWATRRDELSAAKRWALWGAILLIAIATGMMGYTRSAARGDDMMYRVMDKMGDLKEAPQVYLEPPLDGEAIFGANCSACHPGLAGDARQKAQTRHPDADDLVTFLGNPGAVGIAMPPFGGTDAELEALIGYLLGAE